MLSNVVVMMQGLLERVRRGKDEVGASVLEWALIAAVVVAAAAIIGGVIFNLVSEKSSQLETCANRPVGSAGC